MRHDAEHRLAREGHRLLQAGVLLFLLGLLLGLAVPAFAVPRLGLTAHLLALTQGIFLIAIGLLWPRLTLTPLLSAIGCWTAVYSCFASCAVAALGGTWRAGSSMLPMAAGPARGSAIQEGIIAAGLVSSAAGLLAVAVLLLWGLRSIRL